MEEPFHQNFLIRDVYDYQNKKLLVQAINLDLLYKKEKDFNESNIKEYINDNKENLKEDFISFRFAIANPQTLVDSKDFNELFFKKIDEMESSIINNESFEEIIKKT